MAFLTASTSLPLFSTPTSSLQSPLPASNLHTLCLTASSAPHHLQSSRHASPCIPLRSDFWATSRKVPHRMAGPGPLCISLHTQGVMSRTVRAHSSRGSVSTNAVTAERGTPASVDEALLLSSPNSGTKGSSPAAVPDETLPPIPPVPRSIHDISNGDHILGFGAQLGEDHPGFHDEEYKRRRSSLADLAKTHKIGEPIPTVDYTPAELDTWSTVVNTLTPLYPTHACSHFLRSFSLFGFSPERIPQLEELSQVMKEKTGWQIRPVAGLLHPRDFLNGLAFKYFHSTQYIRHGSQPMYTPEPDICHELLGHVPMLADPEFAELAQAIGEASLGATEKEIWHLTKLYWYTVEFGTILEDGEVKAFGAGILSSYGELAYMKDGVVGEDGIVRKPSFVQLDPFSKLPKMSYKDGFQRTYFLCNSFHDVADKLQAYAAHVRKSTVEPGFPLN